MSLYLGHDKIGKVIFSSRRENDRSQRRASLQNSRVWTRPTLTAQRSSAIRTAEVSSGEMPLPSYLQEVDYIESTGTQYIDTQYAPSLSNIPIEYYTEHMKTSSTTSDCAVGGVTSGDSVTQIKLPNYCGGVVEVNSYYKNNSFAPEIINQKVYLKITGNETSVTYDYNGTTATYASDKSLPTSNSLYLFAFANKVTPKYFFIGRIYDAYFKENGVFIRHFIPCLNTETGKYGMFDTVTGDFFGNQGTGDFLGGQPV